MNTDRPDGIRPDGMAPEPVDLSESVRLSPDDEAAIDRAIDGSDGVASDRDARVASLLALLDTPLPGDNTLPTADELADVVLARAGRLDAAQEGFDPSAAPRLSDADGQALDAWALAGYRSAKVPRAFRERAERHEAVARLITETDVADGDTVPGPDAIADAVFARIEADEQDQRTRMTVGPDTGGQASGSGSRFRLTDAFTLAAAVLLAVGIGLPILSETRYAARKAETATDFAAAGGAMGRYGADHRDTLPVYTPAQAAGGPLLTFSWWQTGEDPARSNSANLYTLIRLDYATLEDLSSPGNENAPDDAGLLQDDWRSPDEVSYSYRIVRRSDETGLGPTVDFERPGAVVLLTDKSPLEIEVTEPGEPRRATIDISANSPNHDGRGQQLLRADLSVVWSDSPLQADGDNLWLPEQIESMLDAAAARARGQQVATDAGGLLTGSELPATPEDAFGGP